MIKPFKYWCNPILPLVYDDSLSYYETLCKVSQKLNEVIDTVNNFYSDLDAIVDNKIAEFKKYVDAENAKQDKAVEEKIANVIELIDKQVTALYNYIDNIDTALRHYVTVEIKNMQNYVDKAVLGKIIIYDPTTGYKNNLSEVIEHIYDALRYWGITAYEFDSAKLTCVDIDNKYLTALEFDTQAKELLAKYYRHYLYDPISGVFDSIQRVLYRWFQVYRNHAITCNTFDGKEDTATALDAIEYSAYEFDDIGESLILP